MNDDKLPEVWLRGAIENVPALLQPIAHALLQAREEIFLMMANFSEALLWNGTGGLASPAFHLQHIAGVIDRMVTYKNGQPLSPQQFTYLQNEGVFNAGITIKNLLNHLSAMVDEALAELKSTDINTLTDFREVGRKQLPSTVGGLLFHMAEHTMRHTGQLLVTVKVLQSSEKL